MIAPGQNRRLGWLTVVSLTLILTGTVVAVLYARQRWWLPPLASQAARPVDVTFLIMLATIFAVFIIVHLFLIFVVYRYSRERPGHGLYWHENPRLEIAWTIILAAALTGFLIMGGTVWAAMQAQPASFGPGAGQTEDALTIEIVGRQFNWHMRYPGPDGVLAHADQRFITPDNPLGLDLDDPAGEDDIIVTNHLVLPVDEPVRLQLRSNDVIHSFFVPNFRIKMDTVPGRMTELWLQPSEVGTYEAACAELCGVGHFAMRAQVEVMERARFEAWLADQSSQTQ